MAKQTNPRIKIYKLESTVSLEIDGVEHQISTDVAKLVGDHLFKTACDVEAVVRAKGAKGSP